MNTTTLDYSAVLAAIGGHPKQIYTGLEAGCRCGCHGRYFTDKDRGYTMAFNKALRLNPQIAVTDDPNKISCLLIDQGNATSPVGCAYSANGFIQWIDIALGNGKTITLYTKD